MGFAERMEEIKGKAKEMRDRARIIMSSPNGRSGMSNDGETASPASVSPASFAQSLSPRRVDAVDVRTTRDEAAGVELVMEEGSLVAGVERGYFDEPSTSEPTFDPVLVSLRRLGADFTVEDLSKEEERLSELADRVSSALNREIIAHGEDFEKGMENITKIYDTLEAAGVLLKNSRRSLQRVGSDVKSALRVQGSHTTKGSIIETLRILEDIKFCQTCETKIRSRLDASDYAEAMTLYSKAWSILEGMHGLKCTSTLREDFVALRWELATCVDNVLIDLCGTFDAEKFAKLYEQYPKLGHEVKHLADKIQDAFLKAVEVQTEGMLRLHAMLAQDEEIEAKRKSRMGYKQLCSQLSSMQFVPCLRKTLESLHEIFLSSYRMTAWCQAAMQDTIDSSNAEAINTCSALIAALQINRKPVVEMASVRLAALLQSSGPPSNAAFREVFDLCRVFITCAEAFCGEESQTLRAQLERIGDRYFESLHSARLDASKTIFESERWIPVSMDAVKRVRDDLRSAMQRKKATINGLGKTLGDTAITTFHSDQILDSESFVRFIHQPNPFIATGESNESVATNAEASRADNGVDAVDMSTSVSTEDFASNGEHEHVCDGDDVGLDRAGVKITASSLYILQGIVEYTVLMQVMRPSVPVIFNGICQLFELALVKTFNAFGRTEGLLPDSHDMTPRLRGTLSRLGNSGGVMAIRVTAPSQGDEDILSSGNLYGLKERGIAIESLARVADEFKRIKSRVKRSLPLKDAASADRFYSHTVAAVEDLREHVYKNVASLLLNIGFCAEAIGDGDPNFALVNSTFAGKYNLREAPKRQSKWVDDVSAELLQFTTKLAVADVAPEALAVLWGQAASLLEHVLVDGFSRVKKCTDAGRALMSLDIQTLRAEFTKLAPSGTSTEWLFVTAYIDAFFIPEHDFPKWLVIHPEYTKSQKLSLVHQASAGRRWSAKLRADSIAAIEADP